MQHQLDLQWQTKKKVEKMSLFVVFVYLKSWFNAYNCGQGGWQKFQIIHITSKNGPIRTLFGKSWLWVINLALRTPGEGSMRTTADKGGGGQKLAKFCGRLLWMAP